MKIKFVPDKHQKVAAGFCCSRTEALVTFMTGSGKTFISFLTALRQLKDGQREKIFIVGTKASCIEFEEQLGVLTDQLAFQIKDHEQFVNFVNSNQQIALIQYEFIKYWNLEEAAALIQNIKDSWFFDEVHKLKNPESRLTQQWRALRPYIHSAYGLTATAISSKIYDLYHIVDFLSPNFLGLLMEFKARYLIIGYKRVGRGRRVEEIRGYKNTEELSRRLKDIMVTFYPSQDIDFQEARTDLEDPELYQEAANGFFESTEERAYSARMVDLQRVVDRDKTKLKLWLKTVRKNLHKGVIVYCAYYDAMDLLQRIATKVNIPYMELTGRVSSTKRRKEAKNWFVNDPKGKILFVTNAGGQSYNLQATDTFIFFNIPNGIGPFVQIMGRIVRYYSNFTKFYLIFIGVNDTIDEYKLEYVRLNEPLFREVLKNKLIPESRFPAFSAYILSRLKQRLLWKRS